MVDIEKVKKALDICQRQNGSCAICPYKKAEKPMLICREMAIDILKILQEQKCGQWITHRTQEHDGEWYCDQCGYEPTVFEATPYCPNCGAMMY